MRQILYSALIPVVAFSSISLKMGGVSSHIISINTIKSIFYKVMAPYWVYGIGVAV